jgi:hypothetical protein
MAHRNTGPRPHRRRNPLAAFEEHYNFAARPYNWRYTKNDLDQLLKRLAAHHTGSLAATA